MIAEGGFEGMGTVGYANEANRYGRGMRIAVRTSGNFNHELYPG